ncbi:MAG: RluA family pseudouridine synthase [Candidatus Auribacterota bacterium]|jgi:23S rRNA pseudouridine1911/1915/1917 synthase|nr:RluA family pseudouridine synthase [Candidatus Auribacterota bacterium]
MNHKKNKKFSPLKDRLNVIYEDDSIIVIDKAPFILAQPVKDSNDQSVIELIRLYWKSRNAKNQYLGIVHRLDKETSGLMVLAKSKIAHRTLHIQFSHHKVSKRYMAIVDNIPYQSKGRLTGSISRDQTGKRAITTDSPGKEAVTRYKTLQIFAGKALLELAPETGRAHQIRLQLAHIRCPIVGEFVYTKSKQRVACFNRIALHASKLTFLHPQTVKRISFESPIPNDMQELIDSLKQESDKKNT